MRFVKRHDSFGALSLIVSLCLSIFVVPFGAAHARFVVQESQPTDSQTLERGYRTGYSDGYQAGYGDSADASPRDFENKEEYRSADRTHIAAYGSRELFRDGYQQGYETGYETGYERRPFNSAVPANLSRRNASSSAGEISTPPTRDVDDRRTVRGEISDNRQTLTIPRNTVMLVQLETNLSTDASQPSDRIQARVMEPSEFEGAMLHGVVRSVRRPGKVRGNAELQLAFQGMRLADGRWTELEAQVVEVIDSGEREIGEVDSEGGIRGKDSTKGDVAKVGAGAAIGAIIGAIAGGGKGAAIGATVGGATGAGGVLASRGDDLRLTRGDKLRIRTARTVNVP